jgi:hypothetical protein
MPQSTPAITLGYSFRTRLAPDVAIEKAKQTFQDRGREVVVDPSGSTDSGNTELRFLVPGSIMTETLLLESSIEVRASPADPESREGSGSTEIELMLSAEAATMDDVREAWPEAQRQLDAEFKATRFAFEWLDMVHDLPESPDCLSL